MQEKYKTPAVVYYKEMLAAKVEEREATPYEEWAKANMPSEESEAEKEAKKQPKTAPEWTPNSAACEVCEASFTLFSRRHHCRRCGKCVCKTCAPAGNTRPILEWKIMEPVRHCKECYRSPSIAWTA